MTISDDALTDPVPVTREMACRARQSKEMYGQKMEQGMGDLVKPLSRSQHPRPVPHYGKIW